MKLSISDVLKATKQLNVALATIKGGSVGISDRIAATKQITDALQKLKGNFNATYLSRLIKSVKKTDFSFESFIANELIRLSDFIKTDVASEMINDQKILFGLLLPVAQEHFKGTQYDSVFAGVFDGLNPKRDKKPTLGFNFDDYFNMPVHSNAPKKERISMPNIIDKDSFIDDLDNNKISYVYYVEKTANLTPMQTKISEGKVNYLMGRIESDKDPIVTCSSLCVADGHHRLEKRKRVDGNCSVMKVDLDYDSLIEFLKAKTYIKYKGNGE